MKELNDYLKSMPKDDRDGFAVRCHTTLGYIRKCISTGAYLGPITCVAIERETNGAVTRQMLRPSDFRLIWPDLEKA